MERKKPSESEVDAWWAAKSYERLHQAVDSAIEGDEDSAKWLAMFALAIAERGGLLKAGQHMRDIGRWFEEDAIG